MARTNKYHSSEIKRKRKPSPFTFGKRGLFMLSDLVMYCSLLLCYIFVILSNTSPVDAKLTITGSGGYSSRRIHLDLSDGGYKGIVVKINKDVPEKYCPTILSNIRVRKLYLDYTNKTISKLSIVLLFHVISGLICSIITYIIFIPSRYFHKLSNYN